jgi:hypothetical protein
MFCKLDQSARRVVTDVGLMMDNSRPIFVQIAVGRYLGVASPSLSGAILSLIYLEASYELLHKAVVLIIRYAKSHCKNSPMPFLQLHNIIVSGIN